MNFKSKLVISLAFVATLATAAYAQWQISNHAIPVGRGGGVTGFSTIVPSATSGVALVSRGSSLDPSFTTVVVAGGGTNCTSASGTCLDNITGFSSTGFIKRTGAGAYSFIADPVPVANGGTNCAVASGTCLDNITGFSSTGYLKRTGAGTYTFQASPVPVSEGGTGIASGTSGGILYFSGTTTIASSGALTANLPVIGGGAGTSPTVGTRSGNTTAFVTTTGTQTNGNCVSIDANGNHIASGSTCTATAAPTKQHLTTGTGATYTTPANARSLHIRMVGGGGGGSAAATNSGSSGGTTTFNSINANPGNGGAPNTNGSAGGSGGSGAAGFRAVGGDGINGAGSKGGLGGASAFGGGGRGGAPGQPGSTGAGGGGADGASNVSGGSAGEYVELVIASPSASYTYTVGNGGAGGTPGTTAGGAGGSGVIIVTEYY